MTKAIDSRVAGEAGHWGAEIRSDLHVRIEPRERGGIDIELESRVKPYYGDAIRRQAEEVLEALGVRHAQVTIHDEGALPFVIAARIEAAARRAGLGEGTRVLPDRIPLPEPSPRDRMRRSRLYVPGSEPKYFINAGLHGADAIILDLEDSVHPSEKDAARLLVRNALRAVDFLQCERMVRINQLPLGLEDLEEIVPESPDLILIPKVETSGQVIDASRKIAEIQANYGLTRPIWLMPILESALGNREGSRDCDCEQRNRGFDHRVGRLHRGPRRGENADWRRVAFCAATRGERRPRRRRAGD